MTDKTRVTFKPNGDPIVRLRVERAIVQPRELRRKGVKHDAAKR